MPVLAGNARVTCPQRCEGVSTGPKQSIAQTTNALGCLGERECLTKALLAESASFSDYVLGTALVSMPKKSKKDQKIKKIPKAKK